MTYKVNLPKRILLMFLVAWITFVSVFGAYQKSVEAAEWIAGTVAAIGGAPIFSALLIGGVVVAGGIAIYELSQTSAEDHRNFVDGIKTGFQEFVADQEKQIALEQNSSLSDQEAANLGVANARNYINNFVDNALNVTRTTAKNLKTKTVEYWNKYCKGVREVSDIGISTSQGGIIGSNESFKPKFINYLSGYGITAEPMTNIGTSTVAYNGRSYCVKGQYTLTNGGTRNCDFTGSSNLDIPILFMIRYDNGWLFTKCVKLSFNKTTGQFISSSIIYGGATWGGDFATKANEYIANTSINIIMAPQNGIDGDTTVDAIISAIAGSITSLAIGNASVIPNWKRSVNSALENTHIGSAIRSGRRAKLQSGDYLGSTFVDDSIPLKKTALRVGDITTVGQVGWDIPQPDVWDDVFSGGKPFSDVVRDTGVVAVPSDDVSSYPTDTDVEFPTDTDVQDTDDVIDIPIDDEIEIPERPLPDIIDDQEGDFYPTEMDLTQLFPFCIPFDIIYLVEKFDVSGANAPVITLPLKYPSAIRGDMGSDRYVVTIDLADYVVVRDVIRVFLLLLFIAGLMKITRDLIRG